MNRSPRSILPLAEVILCLLALTWLLPAGVSLAEAPDRPPYYAIRNVMVMSGGEAPIGPTTVLVADGLIDAIGSGVQIPPDAWVIDAEGLTLYPGLIDAMTSLGQKQKEEAESSGGGGQGGPGRDAAPPVRGPEDRPQTTPWLNVADELAGENKAIQKWRKAGFTAVVSAPEKGIFAGQAGLLNLVDAENDNRIVAAPVAQRVNFRSDGGFRTFPGSLMGALAYIQQVFSDTQHYSQAKATYAKDPRGRARPQYDRSLESLEEALTQGMPFLLPGHLGREIDRALALRKEFGLAAVLYGGQGAYTRAGRLREEKVPLLVSLNWPEEEKDRDPEADTPFRTLCHRQMAPTTPMELAKAGVPFAFYSGGLASPAEVFEGVRAAVDAGLSHTAALRALTTDAAAIFGLDDRMGTIEQGKIANLVLASDWPWAEGGEIEAVFVDGHKYQEPKDDEPKEAPAQDVSGTWALTMNTPRGPREMTAEFEMKEDGKVTGEIVSSQGTTTLEEARMSGEFLRFETTRSFGGRSMTASWTLAVEGEALEGSMSGGRMQMDVSGERTSKPVEGSKAVANDDQARVPLEELQAALSRYQGKAQSMKTFAITNADVWTVSGDVIQGGSVVVSDGKIRAVGRDVKIPADAEIIDAQGGSLIPGIIDAHSHIAIEGGVNEGSLAVTSMVSIGDVVNPDDIAIYRALAGGVTSANLLHGSANPIGGQNQVIKLRWGSDAEGMKLVGAPLGIKFALGENPKRSNFGNNPAFPQRYPQTRMGVMDVIRQAFVDAREYQKQWDGYRSSRKRSRAVKASLPRRDLKLEALVEILEGKRLVHSHCYRADEILQLLRLAEEFGFQVATLQHVLEGYKVADEIAAHGAGASTFSDWWGYKVEAYDAIPYNAALMAERNVLVSLNSDSAEEMRHLNQEAAKAVKWGGMDETEALKLVTLNPARQLGIADRLGSIDVGKDADLVLYDGHPLAISSVVQMTFVDGDLYFDLAADRKRQDLVDNLKSRLEGDDQDDDTRPAGDSESAPSPEVRWNSEGYSCQEENR